MREKDEALTDKGKAEAELKTLKEERQKRIAAHQDTGDLDVRAANITKDRDFAQSRADTAGVKIKDRVRTLQFHEDLPKGKKEAAGKLDFIKQ